MILSSKNIHKILSELSKERQIFHSEADFQHALAWKIHETYKDQFQIRLEKRIDIHEKKNSYFDIILKSKKQEIGIELKYKTKDVGSIIFKGELFKLKNQLANDLGRYDFLKDISRLEQFKEKFNQKGFAIFLTNDSKYWNGPKKTNPIDKKFNIGQNIKLSGKLSWDKKAKDGTTKGRPSLVLNNEYEFVWKDYSKSDKFEFKYTLIEI